MIKLLCAIRNCIKDTPFFVQLPSSYLARFQIVLQRIICSLDTVWPCFAGSKLLLRIRINFTSKTIFSTLSSLFELDRSIICNIHMHGDRARSNRSQIVIRLQTSYIYSSYSPLKHRPNEIVSWKFVQQSSNFHAVISHWKTWIIIH